MTASHRPSPAAFLIAAAALSVLLVGAASTVVVFTSVDWLALAIPRRFWLWLLIAAALTLVALSLRTLRWVFLLRRAHLRLPIEDTAIGYIAGLSVVFVPLLAGEAAVRARVHHTRAGARPDAIVALNIWERLLDCAALALLTGLSASAVSSFSIALIGLVTIVTISRGVRAWLLAGLLAATRAVMRRRDPGATPALDPQGAAGLVSHRSWLVALFVSVVSWALPGLGLWGLGQAWQGGLSVVEAAHAFASSALAGCALLAPGGVLIVGHSLLANLSAHQIAGAEGAVTVFAVRLVTAGLATAMGAVCLVMHLRTARQAGDGRHFDALASAYDAQIPRARRMALVTTKTTHMRDALLEQAAGKRGLDVGCGQGWYVAEMRRLGFRVDGLDDSSGQLQAARRETGSALPLINGSMLAIPVANESYDFAYSINVLHHLGSIEDQQAAFRELERILRPGGLLFVHEINTRNLLFRVYMGYVFPVMNRIDEGIERWLLPHRLERYTAMPLQSVRYFTFLPDFLPQHVVRRLAPLERMLETSPLRCYSAHYMAVLRKPSSSASPAAASAAIRSADTSR